MVAKIEAAKGDVEAVYYEGEGHGFRKVSKGVCGYVIVPSLTGAVR